MGARFTTNKKILKYFSDLNNSEVRVGVYGDGVKDSHGRDTNVGKAITHEFGNYIKGVPARPFLRPVILNVKNLVLALRVSIERLTVDAIGAYLSGEVRMYISRMTPGLSWEGTVIKPLNPRTIAQKRKKGRGLRLLQDTRDLIRSITFKTEKK